MSIKRLFNLIPLIIRQSGSLDINRDCNSITFVNTGDNIVFINDQILYPGTIGTNLGDSLFWGGHQDEIFAGYVNIKFQAPATANQQVTVTQKVYSINTAIGIGV